MTEIEEASVYETPDPGDADYTDPQPPPPQYESEFISNEEIDAGQARDLFDRYDTGNRSTDFASLKARGLHSTRRQETSVERLARISRELEELRAEDVDVASLSTTLSNLQAKVSTVKPHQSEIVVAGNENQQISQESMEKLSLLENRLATLENRLGSSTGTNLASQVNLLRIKVNTLTNSPDLEKQILPRLKAFNQEVSTLSETKLASRVDELHASVETMTEIAPRVPLILERLRSLHKVHEDAAEAQMKLQAVKTALSARSTELTEWKASLAAIEDGMKTFAATCAENSELLRAQTQSLHDRLTQAQI